MRRLSSEVFFEYWDEQNGRGWTAFKRTLALGTIPMALWWNNGKKPERPSRVAPPAANRRININRESTLGMQSLSFEQMAIGIA
jgi:hypothetical protein